MDSNKIVIEPPKGLALNFKELWQYRELFYFFTWRDIKVKYKQTTLGIAWALLQPLGLMLLFTFIFSDKNLTGNHASIKYPVFVLSGIIVWQLFASSVSGASESMLQQSNIIKKIYFPRLIIPCSSILVAFFDFAVAFFLFIFFCFIYGQPIHWIAVVYYPAAILLTLLAAFGIGIFLAALNIRFRDFRYVLPFLLQLLFFASQIIYSLDTIEKPWLKVLLALNPMNGVIELFRFPVYGQLNLDVVFISTISAISFGIAGMINFKKTEAYFADLA